MNIQKDNDGFISRLISCDYYEKCAEQGDFIKLEEEFFENISLLSSRELKNLYHSLNHEIREKEGILTIWTSIAIPILIGLLAVIATIYSLIFSANNFSGYTEMILGVILLLLFGGGFIFIIKKVGNKYKAYKRHEMCCRFFLDLLQNREDHEKI